MNMTPQEKIQKAWDPVRRLDPQDNAQEYKSAVKRAVQEELLIREEIALREHIGRSGIELLDSLIDLVQATKNHPDFDAKPENSDRFGALMRAQHLIKQLRLKGYDD